MLQFITSVNENIDTHFIAGICAFEGDCRWVQVRMKNQPIEEVLHTSSCLVDIGHNYGATVIIDDYVEIAMQTGADGVHLGRNDMSVREARELAGNDFIIGATANTFEDIKKAVVEGADYIGLGPFRFTTTKENLSPVLGIEGYRTILAQCREAGMQIPIVAIGGITREDIPELLGTGICGVAISGGIINKVGHMEEFFAVDRCLRKCANNLPHTAIGKGKKLGRNRRAEDRFN